MKKIVTAGLVFALMLCLSSALAGGAGSSSDPLISKSFIEDTYNNIVLAEGSADITEKLQGVYDSAASRLTTEGLEGAKITSGYLSLVVPAGASVALSTGSSVIATAGAVGVFVNSGAVIDITAAAEVPSGSALTLNKRYFLAEDTIAVFSAASKSVISVNGEYAVSEGVTEQFVHYSDVPPLEWFYDSAVYAYNNKIFPDWENSRFRPSDASTRAETVYALWMAVGCPAAASAATYSDLTEDWYMTAVSWATENGIIKGGNDNLFMPNDSLTREQLAVIMYRYTQYSGGNVYYTSDLSSFTDSGNIADWAYNEMCWANAAGIITGTSKTEMSPQMTAGRSQVATVLMRYVSR